MRSHPDVGDEQETLEKRARLTDTDMASIAQVTFCLCLFVCVFATGVLISPVFHAIFAYQVRNSTPDLSQSSSNPTICRSHRFNAPFPNWRLHLQQYTVAFLSLDYQEFEETKGSRPI